jgi:hypothetical protein
MSASLLRINAMRLTMTVAAISVATLLVGAPAAAQDVPGPQGVRIELSYEHSSFDASTHRDMLGPSAGFDLSIGFHLDPHFMLVAGVQSGHAIHSDSTTEGISPVLRARSTVTELYAEPRLVLINRTAFEPYVFVRLAYVRSSQTLISTTDDGEVVSDVSTQDGSGLGGGIGFSYHVRGRYSVHASGAWQRISLGNLYFSGNSDPDTGVQGSSIVVRVGASIDIGAFRSAFRTAPGQ